MSLFKNFKKDIGQRPICPICNTRERAIGKQRKDGSYNFQKMCTPCKHAHLEKKNGVSYVIRCAQNAGCNSVKENKDRLALENGFTNYLDYLNSKHPYRKHRKHYCENIDGRLGIPCTTTISILSQLDVDHIDGNARNNKPENLQTLCKCCHTYKTLKEKDYSTPGRKSLGITY